MDSFYSYYVARAHELTAFVVTARNAVTRDGIHRLRVTIKKLKTIFSLLEYLDPGFDSKYHINQIKPLFAASGKVRDLEIAISQLGKIASGRVLDKLRTSRKQKVHALHELLKDLKPDTLLPTDEVASVCTSSRNEIKHVRRFLSLAGHELVKDFSGRIKKKQLHDMRKRLKEFYYVTEIVRSMLLNEKSSSQLLTEIEMIQHQLGKWHDVVITINKVKKLSDRKADIRKLDRFLKEREKKKRLTVIKSISKSEICSYLSYFD